MRTPLRTKTHIGKIIVVSVILILLLAGVVIYSLYTRNTVGNSGVSQSGTSAQQTQNEQQAAEDKQTFLDEEAHKNTSPESSNQEVKPVVDFTVKKDVANVIVSTSLTNVSSGTCTLSLSHTTGATIKRVAPVIYADLSSTCAGFTIDRNDLNSGSWTISLAVDQAGTTIGTKTVNYLEE